MQTIYKYPLEIRDVQIIEMPPRAKLLSVQCQNKTLCLWALVDNSHVTKSPRTIEIRGTGHSCEGLEGKYIGTVQIGNYVWHVFDGGWI